MSDRERILIFSVLVLAGGMFCAAAVTVAILYKLELKEQRNHLTEMARAQAHFMGAVAAYNAIHCEDEDPGGSAAVTLSQIAAAHERHPGFGETGELVIARREGDQIVFLYPYRHGDGSAPDPVPWRSELAEPLRRALSGQEGTLIGLDCRGERVLAAYQPVAVLNLGVVAKADLAEIRAPFVMAALSAGGVTVLLVLVGARLTFRVTDPSIRQLQESEERLRLTLDAVSDGAWNWNVVTGEDRHSDRWLDSLGYQRDEVPPHVIFWESIVHSNDLPHCMKVLNAHLDGRTLNYECENRLRTASGEYRWNLGRGRVVARDSAGKPLRMVGTSTDITGRKQTEETLRVTQFAVDQSSDAIYWVRADGRISYVNRSACEQLGYSYAELISMSVPEIAPDFPQEDWPAHWDEMKRAGAMTFEAHHQTKDGEVFLVEISTNHLLYEGEEYICAYVRNIAERKQAENEPRKLSVAVEQSPAMILITDTNGTIEYVNPRFTEVTGYTKEEVIGRNPRILKSGKWPKKAYEALWKTILAGKTWRGEFENKKKNGELYWESASISPVRNAQGEVTHFLAVKEDITERKRREEELRNGNAMIVEALEREKRIASALEALREKAEAANRAKSEFLANMSHEIRTPMTAILGFTETLLDPAQSDSEKRNAIHTVRRNGEHLLQIINDILDISKIEADKFEVECIRCSPVQIVSEVKSLMQVPAEAKNLPFNIEYGGAIPETIESDPTRLKQILVNLVGNAIKFTETGGVKLITRFVPGERKNSPGERKDPLCEKEDKENLCPSVMQFDVLDTGIGMTQEQAGKLFQVFAQADTSTTREFGGTGLGLMISKRLAELLGGTITIESKPGEGSLFRVAVATGALDGVKMLDDPLSATMLDTDGAAGFSPCGAAQAEACGSSKLDCRILLAEDGPGNQRLIAYVLKKAGAQVMVVENGKLAADAALAACDEGNPFDVILMDMQMPVMDGYEATGLLRQKGYTRPIIALTAHAMAGDRQKCIDAGCDDYASKPIGRKTLVAKIQEWRKTLPIPEEKRASLTATDEPADVFVP